MKDNPCLLIAVWHSVCPPQQRHQTSDDCRLLLFSSCMSMSRDTRGQQYVFRNVQDRDECFNLIKTHAELAKANSTTSATEVLAYILQMLHCYIRCLCAN
jgi:hypothetical protein